MIEITSPMDYPKLKSLPPLISQHIQKYCNSLLEIYAANTLKGAGGIFCLEHKNDCKNHIEVGLSRPLAESSPEFTEQLTIKGSNQEIKILHACFVLNNSTAISVFAEPKNLDTATLAVFIDGADEREVNIV